MKRATGTSACLLDTSIQLAARLGLERGGMSMFSYDAGARFICASISGGTRTGIEIRTSSQMSPRREGGAGGNSHAAIAKRNGAPSVVVLARHRMASRNDAIARFTASGPLLVHRVAASSMTTSCDPALSCWKRVAIRTFTIRSKAEVGISLKCACEPSISQPVPSGTG